MNLRDFDAGPLEHVEHQVDGARSTLVFVHRSRHSPAKVWGALTEAAQLRRWAPFDPDRNLNKTGRATLRMTDGDAVEHFPSRVLRVVPLRLLEYTWGDDVLCWKLAPDGRGTKLTLRHTVDTPDWVPRTAAGWHLCFVVAERLMDGAPIPPIVGADAKNYGWDQLHDAYAARLGISGGGWPKTS